MLELKGSSILKLADNYIMYSLDIEQGMYWLFDINEGTYYDLNEVSYFELSLLDGKNSYDQVCNSVLAKFTGEDPQIIIHDLYELLTELQHKRIITSINN